MKKIKTFIDKRFSLFVCTIILGLTVLQFVRTWGYFMDDGFIMLRYVENILNGNGWVFNIGEYYNASTSILQILWHVVLGFIFGINNLEIIAYVNFYVWMFVFALFVYKFFFAYNRYVAAIIAFVVLLIPHFYATFGIETAMNMAFLFIALFAYQKKHFSLLYPILSLMILTRFENGLFVAIVFLFLLFKDKLSLRTLAKNGILLSIPFISWFIFSYIYFGKMFPESLAAKMWQGESGYFGNSFMYIKSMILYVMFFVMPWIRVFKVSFSNWLMSAPEFFELLKTNSFYFFALIVTGVFVIKGLIISVRKKTASGVHILLIWGLVHTSLYGILLRVPGYHWYYSIVIVTLISTFFIGIYAWEYKRLYVKPILLILLIIPYILVFAMSSHVTIEDARTTPYRNLSEWINENASKDAVIVHDEVGEIAYLTQRKTIDGFGLTSPQYLPSLKKGLRDIFWMLEMEKYNEVYYVSYHDVYPSSFVKDLFAPMLVYEGQDSILVRLYKLDKTKFVFPKETEVSPFFMNYKLSGPKDRVGTKVVDMRPEGTICPSFALHAQNSKEEPVVLSITDFNEKEKFTSFSFHTVFPLEAIQNGTDGASINVTASYEDGTSETKTFIYRIELGNSIQNNKEFSFLFDTTKILKKVELSPYDENNQFDWLHICNPVFVK